MEVVFLFFMSLLSHSTLGRYCEFSCQLDKSRHAKTSFPLTFFNFVQLNLPGDVIKLLTVLNKCNNKLLLPTIMDPKKARVRGTY